MTDTPSIAIVTTTGSIQITQDGAKLPPNLSYEEWFEQVRAMRQVKHLYHAALSDLVKYGRAHFGNDSVDNALTQLHFDLSDVYRANALLALDSGVKLKPALTNEHRYVLGRSLADSPEKQNEWADTALRENLNPTELKLSIEQGRLVRGLRNERSPGVVTFESVLMMFQRAVKQYGGAKKIKQLPDDEISRIRDLLQPVVNFAEGLA